MNNLFRTKRPPTSAHVDRSPGVGAGGLEDEIARLDRHLLALVVRRTELAQTIACTAMVSRSNRKAGDHELDVLQRFRVLGAEGHTLAMILLRLCRNGAVPAAHATASRI